jgi:two-component system sensor kinase FixL
MFSNESRALMEAAVDAVIVIDEHGTMLLVNAVTARIFGYTVEEMLGRNVNMLMPEPDRSEHDGYVQRCLRTGEAKIVGIGREVTARRQDGSLFPARLSVGRIAEHGPPRFVGMLRDVSAEHRAVAALKLQRDRAQAFLELHEAILLELDATGRVHDVNAHGANLLGAPADSIRGRHWVEFFDGDEERERALLLLEGSLATGLSREREFDALDALGARRRIYWRCVALKTVDESSAGWLCSGSDVTDRALREVHAHFAQDRLARVARLATLGEMAAGMAHELNQPLAAITTYASACERYLAKPQPDRAELEEAVREIGAEGLRAGDIIRKLRQLVRNDSGGEHALIDLNAWIDELRLMLSADARLYGAELRVHLAPVPRVRADGAQLQQVILNLARNAFEALLDAPAGERQVEIATLRPADGSVELRITDNGPGISADVADRLFAPFATTKRTGTGLGLAMSRTIVQAHGGTIGVRPITPRGSSFYVRLPAQEECLT